MRNSIMGSPDCTARRCSGGDLGDSAKQSMSGAAEEVRGTAQDATGAIRDSPDAVTRQTRGNPLAAGAIAFGVGPCWARWSPPPRRSRAVAQIEP